MQILIVNRKAGGACSISTPERCIRLAAASDEGDFDFYEISLGKTKKARPMLKPMTVKTDEVKRPVTVLVSADGDVIE